MQEALDLRQHAATESLHFTHSVVETSVTFLFLVIHMLNTRVGYVKVLRAVQGLEHFDPDDNAQLRTIKTWMWLSIAGGFVLVSICVGCFIAFYGFVHLGWTVLSNQVCIVTCLLMFGLYGSRVMRAVSKITADQQKVGVIYRSCTWYSKASC